MPDNIPPSGGISEWFKHPIDSAKSFITPKENLEQKSDESVYKRIQDFFYWAKVESKPQSKVIKGTSLIGAAQIFSFPGFMIGYIIGGAIGATRGLFKSKNSDKPRIQEVKDRASEGIQIATRLAAILPTTWIAMGLASWGEKYIKEVTPFESESNNTIEKSFSLANLILSKGHVPLKMKTHEDASLPPKKEIHTIMRQASSSQLLNNYLESIKFSPPESVGPEANNLIQKYVQDKTSFFRANFKLGNSEHLKEIQQLKTMLKEAEEGNIFPLREAVIKHHGKEDEWGLQPDFNLPTTHIRDITVDLSPKNTPVSSNWVKASLKEKNTRSTSTQVRYDLFKGAHRKNLTLTTAAPSPYLSKQSFSHSPTLNVHSKGGIPYLTFVRWKDAPIDAELECFPALAEAIDSNIIPYKDQNVPLATAIRNLSPDYTYEASKGNDTNYIPLKNAPPVNVMVIELPVKPSDSLSPEEFAKLSWQITSAEFNAFETTLVTEDEYENSDRHVLVPLGIESSKEELFIRAALFITEASLRQVPIAIPDNSPIEFLLALDVVNEYIIPEIKEGSDRERIVSVIADAAQQIKNIPPDETT
ncbi:MAG: hypothetical protein WC222_06270 [Parachlamydiales bacterium]|jgi:hypothetical protein